MKIATESPTLNFQTIVETQGLEFVWQARQIQNDFWPE